MHVKRKISGLNRFHFSTERVFFDLKASEEVLALSGASTMKKRVNYNFSSKTYSPDGYYNENSLTIITGSVLFGILPELAVS